MKSPSKNISRSLSSQRVPGRGEEQISVTTMGGSPSMIVPGEGKVETPPGREHERCASKYVTPQRRYGGG